MDPAFIIALIILGAGILGGFTNFFLVYTPDQIPGKRFFLSKSILMGICASLTVPLFLQVLPNSLLDLDKMVSKNYFILAGLCVLAAFFSKRFLEDLYSRLNNLEKKTESADKKAEEAKKEADDVAMGNAEIDNINGILDDIAKNVVKNFKPEETADDIKKIADAVINTKYSYRTVHGISEDTKYTDEKVRKILELLQKAGYVESRKIQGKNIWKSTYHRNELLAS
jgi:hypothetical protein